LRSANKKPRHKSLLKKSNLLFLEQYKKDNARLSKILAAPLLDDEYRMI
jgi:hypothetical protein